MDIQELLNKSKITEEEYNEGMQSLRVSRSNLLDLEIKLKTKYKDQQEFKVGNIVNVWNNKKLLGTFVIARVSIQDWGIKNNINYGFNKLKKDGTPSKSSAGIYWYDKIELA